MNKTLKIRLTLLLLLVAAFCFGQTDATFRNLDVRDKTKLRGLIYPFGAVSATLNPNTDEVALVRTPNFSLIRVDFWEFLDSIANHITGGLDTFYMAYGCYGNTNGWKHSGDTLFIDTCFAGGTYNFWYLFDQDGTEKDITDLGTVRLVGANGIQTRIGLGNDSVLIEVPDTLRVKHYLRIAPDPWEDTLFFGDDNYAYIAESSNMFDINCQSDPVAAPNTGSILLSTGNRSLQFYTTPENNNYFYPYMGLHVSLGSPTWPWLSFYGRNIIDDSVNVFLKLPVKDYDTVLVTDHDTVAKKVLAVGGDTCEFVKDNINDEISVKSNTTQVGIGTHDPTEMLDVVGNINVPTTTASEGLIKENGTTILHTYHEKNDNNLFLGQGAGNFTLDSSWNIGIGDLSLMSLTTGYSNIGIGHWTLKFGTNIKGNVAIGDACMSAATSGTDQNTAVGFNALYSDNGGDQNCAFGYQSLKSNTTGNYNVGIGSTALYSNVGNNYSVAIGIGAMYYSDSRASGRTTYNTAIGYEAMKGSSTAANNTGQYNTAVGYAALDAMTSCNNNVAMGKDALGAVTTGSDNTGIGYLAMQNVTTGTGNTALGRDAIGTSSAGALNNTGVGYYALQLGTAANHTLNTSIGYYAGNGLGLSSIIISQQNICVGANAGQAMAGATAAQANYNITIGSSAGRNLAANNSKLATNNILIGYQSGYDPTPAYTYGLYNIAMGDLTLQKIVGADSNITIGYKTGNTLTTGDNNILIGNKAGMNLTTQSKQLHIGLNSTFLLPLIYGEMDNDIVKINGTKVERTDKTIADNDATPDVSGSNLWIYAGTANAVTITDLDNPDVGAIYYIVGNSDTYTITIADGGNFNLNAATIVLGHDDVLILLCLADNNYIQLTPFSDN